MSDYLDEIGLSPFVSQQILGNQSHVFANVAEATESKSSGPSSFKHADTAQGKASEEKLERESGSATAGKALPSSDHPSAGLLSPNDHPSAHHRVGDTTLAQSPDDEEETRGVWKHDEEEKEPVLPPTYRYPPKSDITTPPTTERLGDEIAVRTEKLSVQSDKDAYELSTERLMEGYPGSHRKNDQENVGNNSIIDDVLKANKSLTASTTSHPSKKYPANKQSKIKAPENTKSANGNVGNSNTKLSNGNVLQDSSKTNTQSNLTFSKTRTLSNSNGKLPQNTNIVKQNSVPQSTNPLDQRSNFSKPSSAATSQSGKYLFRPLSTRKPLNGDQTSRTEREAIVKKKMAEIWSKTFKSTQDVNLFLGDITGTPAILTDRPPTGRTGSRLSLQSEGLTERSEDLRGHEDNWNDGNLHDEQDIIGEWFKDKSQKSAVSKSSSVNAGVGVNGGARRNSISGSDASGRTNRKFNFSTGGSQSARQPTPRKYRVRYRPGPKSHVDESLFGSPDDIASFSAPWNTRKEPKPFNFDYTDYRTKSAAGNEIRLHSRSSSRQSGKASTLSRSNSLQSSISSHGRAFLDSSSQKPSSGSKATPGRPPRPASGARPTYVDESLFGSPEDAATWKPPWKTPASGRSKPHVFDATDYRQRQGNNDDIVGGVVGFSICRSGSVNALNV